MKKIILGAVVLLSLFVIIFIAVINSKNIIRINKVIMITGKEIDNPLFSVDVPEDWVGNVSYCIRKDLWNTKNAYFIVFYHNASYNTADASALENGYFGALGFISWHGSENAYYDLTNGEDFDWGKDSKAAPVPYTIIQMNQDKTGAYILTLPSDVQFTPETEKDFLHYEGEVVEVLNKIAFKHIPE